MRADRLLAILLLLQRRGRMTARDLAERLEVSERTIYRDLEALGAAGVPVYAEPGRNGGIRLLPGYETDLSGLSLSEAELLPLLGLSEVFSSISTGASLRRTEAKVLATLPDEQRKRAEAARRKIHVDLARWWHHTEDVPYLTTIVEAVFAGRRLRMRYKRGQDQSVVSRTVDPYGLVVQGGTWYVVAHTGKSAEPRIYRVSRIEHAEATDDQFEIPDDFDLAAFWAGRKDQFHMTRPGYAARVRVRPRAIGNLTHGHGPTPPSTTEEWIEIEISFETKWAAAERILGQGTDVVVLEPQELRDIVAGSIERMQSLYTG
jgi:predicted DNA-binding transcriptional regulator YafY